MPRDPRPRLDDILRSIEWIEDGTKGMEREVFWRDRRTRQLVERNVEIISEPSRHIPDALKTKHPEIPWREIAGIGSVLRHDYVEVDPKVLWDLVRGDIGPLKRAVRAMLDEAERSYGGGDPV